MDISLTTNIIATHWLEIERPDLQFVIKENPP